MFRPPFCIAIVLSIGSFAFGQSGAITNIGTTTSNIDALAFNGSGTLYGATGAGNGSGSLYTINPSTGAATLVGALVDSDNSSLHYALSGLAFQPGTGTLYGSTSNNSATSSESLVIVNPVNGQITLVGSFAIADATAADIAFSPGGTLYGRMTDATLATINVSTGAATEVGPSEGDNIGNGLAANASGVLYCGCNTVGGEFWTLNPSTGAHTAVGTLSGGPGLSDAISAMAFSSGGVLYAINGGDDGDGWNLVTINVSGSTPPATPVPPTFILAAIGIIGIALFQMRSRIAQLLRG